MLFVPGASPEGEASSWSVGRRMATAAAVAAVCALTVSPMILRGSAYGPRIHPDDLVHYPEAGPGGRYQDHNRPPFEGLVPASGSVLEEGIEGAGRPSRARSGDGWTWTRAAGGLGSSWAGCSRWPPWDGYGCPRRMRRARRFLILPVVAGLAYLISRLVYPYWYIPARYLFYTVPPVAYLVLAAGAAGLRPFERIPRKWLGLLGAIPGALALLVLGGRGSPDVGFTPLDGSTAGGYEAIRDLPESALLAGWPSGMVRQRSVAHGSTGPRHVRNASGVSHRLHARDASPDGGRRRGLLCVRLPASYPPARRVRRVAFRGRSAARGWSRRHTSRPSTKRSAGPGRIAPGGSRRFSGSGIPPRSSRMKTSRSWT